ncbi:unnamed protein product [Nezara viridula]|uniref:Neuropeptide n=1 Tax=Nezara viridula TaxID=85310 RepID=A0A9P0HNN0_NEZVI|nr:unnamed protein product [Nezara viridula]
MKTILLLLFTMHQTFFFSSALKCYECAGDCKSPKEVDCAADIKCCYSSVAAVGGGAAGGGAAAGETTVTPTAAPPPRMKRDGRSEDVTRKSFFTERMEEIRKSKDIEGDALVTGFQQKFERAFLIGDHSLASKPEHNFKGCCTDKTTKDTCKDDSCYLCESDLCNKGNSGATAVLASILNILLPLAAIAVVIASPPAIRRGMTAEYLQDEAAAAPSTEAPAAAAGDAGASGGAGAAEHPAAADKEGEGGENEHKYKGCCEESITKDTCPNDEHCYLCEGDLCNKESTSSASAVLASILNTLLPLAIIGGVIGSHEIFII